MDPSMSSNVYIVPLLTALLISLFLLFPVVMGVCSADDIGKFALAFGNSLAVHHIFWGSGGQQWSKPSSDLRVAIMAKAAVAVQVSFLIVVLCIFILTYLRSGPRRLECLQKVLYEQILH